jgi:hypothetical protein
MMIKANVLGPESTLRRAAADQNRTVDAVLVSPDPVGI